MRKTSLLALAGLALGFAACGGVAGEGGDVEQDAVDDGSGGDVGTDAPPDDTAPDEAALDDAAAADGDDDGGADADLDVDALEADGNLADTDAGDGEGGTGETGEDGVVEIVPADGDGGPPRCGNGIVEPPDEECDDGNETDGDGCDTDCTFSCHADVPSECPDDGNPCTTEICIAALVGYVCTTEFNTDPCTDGDPCTVEDRCFSGDCVGERMPDWYADVDDDSYGDPESTMCAWEVSEGWVGNRDDCCDADPDVNPGQTAFFAEGYSCGPLPVVLWDYDCDGRDEQRWVNCLICSRTSGGAACDVTPGWLPSADGACAPPACGTVGGWAEGPLSCAFDPTTSSCNPTMAHVALRQQCR
jgi:cysteine-rich repeat protein